MPSFTRKAIKDAFLKLLDERPLKEITVKDIVEECGINRNSFYYHYQDMPALIEEIVREESDAVIKKYSSIQTIVECFDAIMEFVSNRRRAILHIYRSLNRDVFERYLMQTCEYFVRNYMARALADEHIDQADEELIIGYYKCDCFGLMIDWLEGGMKEESVQDFRRIFYLQTDMAVEFARKFKEGK